MLINTSVNSHKHNCELSYKTMELSYKTMIQSLFKSIERFPLILLCCGWGPKWMITDASLQAGLSTSLGTGDKLSWWSFHWLYWNQDFPYACLDNQLYVLFNDQEAIMINLEIPSWIIDLQPHKIALPMHYNWYSYTILRYFREHTLILHSGIYFILSPCWDSQTECSFAFSHAS